MKPEIILNNILKYGIYSLLFILICEPLYAWGPASHLMFDSYILAHISLIAAIPIKKLLKKYANDFLYGSIAPDIFVGKGSFPDKHHSHNWSVGFKIFENAADDAQKAFAYGYLTHLSADCVAHNFFVPYNIFRKKNVGMVMSHIYWELLFDTKLPPQFNELAEYLLKNHNQNNDIFLKSIIAQKKSFDLRKSLFNRIIKLLNSKVVQKTLTNPKLSEALTQNSLDFFIKSNISVCADIINNLQKSSMTDFDPVGSVNLLSSKFIKKRAPDNPFFLPDIIQMSSIKKYSFKYLHTFNFKP